MDASWACRGEKARKECHGDKNMLVTLDSATLKYFCENITGYETGIYEFEPQNKKLSSIWVLENKGLPTKVRKMVDILLSKVVKRPHSSNLYQSSSYSNIICIVLLFFPKYSFLKFLDTMTSK